MWNGKGQLQLSLRMYNAVYISVISQFNSLSQKHNYLRDQVEIIRGLLGTLNQTSSKSILNNYNNYKLH